jgi:hypothetical protein
MARSMRNTRTFFDFIYILLLSKKIKFSNACVAFVSKNIDNQLFVRITPLSFIFLYSTSCQISL